MQESSNPGCVVGGKVLPNSPNLFSSYAFGTIAG